MIEYWAHMLDEAMSDKAGPSGMSHDALLNMEVPRVPYSFNTPGAIIAALEGNKPVDMMNPLRSAYNVRPNSDFSASAAKKYEVKPGMLTAVLGDGIVCQANEVFLYESGLAAAPLRESEEFLEALERLTEAVRRIGDYGQAEDRVKRTAALTVADGAAETNWRRTSRLAAVRMGDKVSRRKIEQEKQKAERTKSKTAKNAVAAEIRKLADDRNKALLDTKFSRPALEALFGGRLIVDEKSMPFGADDVGQVFSTGNTTVLYWYPTLTDLCRFLKDDGEIPLKILKNINARDQKFSPLPAGDLIYESFDTVQDGKSGYDDFLFSWHKAPDGRFVSFARVKGDRWQAINDLAPNRDFGEIFCRIENIRNYRRGDPMDAVIFKNGICMMYAATHSKITARRAFINHLPDPLTNGHSPVTTMFLTPEMLIFTIGGVGSSPTVTWVGGKEGFVPVSMLNACAERTKNILENSSYTFVRTSGTRRYVI